MEESSSAGRFLMEKETEIDKRMDKLMKRESKRRKQEAIEEEAEARINRAAIPDVDIYIYMDGDQWYSFKASSNSTVNSADIYARYSGKIDLKPAFPPFPEPIIGATFADFGSFIFASGGLSDAIPDDYDPFDSDFDVKPFVNKVFYIDTLHPKEGWKAAPSMKATRFLHKMLVDAGKIFVVGGLDFCDPPDMNGEHIFAEVFDPLNPDAGWKPLARCVEKGGLDLPQNIDGYAVLENGPMDRKILFHSYNKKSLFYLSLSHQDAVGIYDWNFGKFHTRSVSIGKTFFFLDPYNRFYAYDICTSSIKAMRVDLIGAKANTLPHTNVLSESAPVKILQSLGDGYLALIWMRAPEGVSYYDIHCSIIKMSRFGDSFVAKVVNYSSHSVKFGGCLSSCIAVWRPESSSSVRESEMLAWVKRGERYEKQHERKKYRLEEVRSSLSSSLSP